MKLTRKMYDVLDAIYRRGNRAKFSCGKTIAALKRRGLVVDKDGRIQLTEYGHIIRESSE